MSNLIQNYVNLMTIIESDEDLKGVDEAIEIIRRRLDDCEAELHRFSYRIRIIMKRIEKRMTSTIATGTTTPSILDRFYKKAL